MAVQVVVAGFAFWHEGCIVTARWLGDHQATWSTVVDEPLDGLALRDRAVEWISNGEVR
jgi:hypothetical protein